MKNWNYFLYFFLRRSCLYLPLFYYLLESRWNIIEFDIFHRFSFGSLTFCTFSLSRFLCGNFGGLQEMWSFLLFGFNLMVTHLKRKWKFFISICCKNLFFPNRKSQKVCPSFNHRKSMWSFELHPIASWHNIVIAKIISGKMKHTK